MNVLKSLDRLCIGIGGFILDHTVKTVTTSAIVVTATGYGLTTIPRPVSKYVLDIPSAPISTYRGSHPIFIEHTLPEVTYEIKTKVKYATASDVLGKGWDIPKGKTTTIYVKQKERVKDYAELYAEEVFRRYNLPAGLATRMLRIESGTGEHMISRTNAKGWYQFTSKTARAYQLKNPFDLKESTEAAARLSRDNQLILDAYGVNSDKILNIYLGHCIGPYNLATLVKINKGEYVKAKRVIALRSVMKHNWGRSIPHDVEGIKRTAYKFHSFFNHKLEAVAKRRPL